MFHKLKARKTAFGFEAYVTTDSVVMIGRAVEMVRIIDPAVIVATNPSGGMCKLTIHSNMQEIDDAMQTYLG